MSHIVNKQNIFDFLKSKSIIIEISSASDINISEDKNIGTDRLQKVNLTNLNSTSKYWQLNPETTTFLQPKGKKVESIVIELMADNNLNIFLIEMKSKCIRRSTINDIEEKFSISISWIYLLLNLLNHEINQNIKVFGILVAQKNMNWNSRETLNILSSTSIRYKKKSFFTEDTEYTIDINNLF